MGFRTTCDKRGISLAAWLRGVALPGLAALLLGWGPAAGAEFDEALELLADMEDAWSRINDYSKLVDKTERLVNGDVTQQTVFVKFRRPGQYYMTVLEGPNKDGELIYPAREGSDLAVAHAGGFKGGFAKFLQKTVIFRRVVPTEFRLDDPTLGEWQHQTATDTDIGSTIAQIAGNIRRGIDFGEGEITVSEDCDDDSRCLFQLDFAFPAGVGKTHAVRAGETLWNIAADYGRPMYVIWYNNPDVRGPRKLKPGMTLFVPRYYSARGSVWVSPETLLPTQIDIFDAEERLYERYVYRDVQLNLGLTDLDFDPKNPDYRF